MQLLHCSHVFSRSSRRLLIWVIEFVPIKVSVDCQYMQMETRQDGNILCSLVLTITTTLHYLLHHFGINSAPDHAFHHRQVFEVVMCLEQRISSEEFH